VADRFRPNPGFVDQLERSAKFAAFLKGLAEVGARKAQSLAKAEAYDSGDYAKGIKGEVGFSPTGLVGRINAHDFKSGILEVHGTQGGRGRGILRRSAETLSTRFTEGGRS